MYKILNQIVKKNKLLIFIGNNTHKMVRYLFTCILILLLDFSGDSQVQLSNTNLIKLDFAVLSKKKQLVKAKNKEFKESYKELLNKADKLLYYRPVSVMDKTMVPPSGDKHDYMSLAPYWWPDSSKLNGLPYIRKDGHVNPEVKDYLDKENMPKLCENIYLLGLAYYYSDNEKYAAHAAKLLQVWFLEPATKMNPNLKYGQAVKGITEGRAEGIIDTRQFIFAIDGIELIRKSKHWTKENEVEIKKWFSQFLNWLITSDIGKDEMSAENNHGTWFDAQALSIALFIDSISASKTIIERAINRLDKQMDSLGFFPLELKRTNSLHYSIFTLNAFAIIAQLAEKAGIDLWSIHTASGKSLKKGLEAILPYITKAKPWFSNQIKEFNSSDAFQILLRGGTKLNCNSCAAELKKIAIRQSRLHNLL
jgi:Alginate lyase